MKRRSSSKPHAAMSLFPFLAVLMCTFGALLVLLVVVMQKARTDGASISAQRQQQNADQAANRASLQDEKDVHLWRRQVLEKQREELQKNLTGRRMTLSHLEDHIRTLERDWRALSAQAIELQKLGTDKEQDQAAISDEMARVQRDIAAANQELATAKEKAKTAARSFAIVPYEGPNGTKRRPIFIECTDEGITLQPEGIVLTVRDFEGDLGPGNPLDAALRATREYLMRIGITKIHGEPYPLLIVRPSGTVAYGVARAAIRAWDDEFGYELVDAEMKLEYPPADATLRNELDRSITDARQRQAILAAAMPGRFNRSKSQGLVATSGSGFQNMGGSEFEEGPAYSARGASPPVGSFAGAFGPPPQQGNSIFGTPATLASSPGAGTSHYAAGTGSSDPSRGVPGGSATGSPGGHGNVNSGNAGAPGGGAGPAQSGAGGAGSAGSAGGGRSGAGSGSVMQGTFAQNGPAGENANATGGAASAPSGAMGMPGLPKSPSRPGGAGHRPLAAMRGENWGLPNRNPTATGFTRSIRVQCLADQLRIMPETGDYRAPIIIPTPDGISPAVDSLVTAVWKRTESWGIAAEGGYWKPVLRVEVASNAEDRFEELRTLLDGSGVPVERR